MGRLSGKRTIVTGAGSGIGRASAQLFAAEGAAVLAVDRSEAGVAETVATITGAGGRAVALAADVGDEAAVKAYVERAVAEFGGLDVVYANAGISGGLVPLFEQSVELWQEILRVNLIGPFLAIKHAAPLLVSQGSGSIICTASVAGLRANAGGNPYSASKAGVISLVQTVKFAIWHRRAGQRHLPGADRDRHDQADLRPRPRPRLRGQNRPVEPAGALRRAARNSRHGAVPGQRRCLLCQWPGDRRRWRVVEHASVRPAAALTAVPVLAVIGVPIATGPAARH